MSDSYVIYVRYGTNSWSGSFQLEEMPGNCGYEVLTYCRINDETDAHLTVPMRKHIAQAIASELYEIADDRGISKIIVSAITKREYKHGLEFDTIDLIEYQDMVRGDPVCGSHCSLKSKAEDYYETVCAELDIKGHRKMAPRPKILNPIEGLAVSVEMESSYHW